MEDDDDIELEAMKGVYGNDVKLLGFSPPCVQVLLKPRTADDISQQFVEATLEIQATEMYPALPPILKLSNAKGLSEKKQADLISTLNSLISKLSDEPMFLVICEAAMDWITHMNAPEDDCCFCLFPLVFDNAHGDRRPYMKLMSCFHCFHSDCFGSWWRWLQSNECKILCQPSSSSQDIMELTEGSFHSHRVETFSTQDETVVALCPVCRTAIHATDVAHIEEYLTTDQTGGESEVDEGISLLSILNEESTRQALFAENFAIQQARGSIIEPKKLVAILPGMYLAAPLQSLDVQAAENTSKEDSISKNPSLSSTTEETTTHIPVKTVDPYQACHHSARNGLRISKNLAHKWQPQRNATLEKGECLQDVELQRPKKGKVRTSRGKKQYYDHGNDM